MNTPRIRFAAVLLALMSAGCDRLVNRYGRGPAKACELGLVAGCREGVRRGVDPVDRAVFQRRLCDLGEIAACSDFGTYLYEAEPPVRDRPRARELWSRACERDVRFACRNLGIYAEVEQHDLVLSLAHHERGCTLGDGPSCRAAGSLVGGSDRATARARFDRACALGDEVGCGQAGISRVMYEPRELARGVVEMRRGCEVSDASSCFNLGISERDGEGVPANPVAADRDLMRACTLNHAAACTWVAVARYRSAQTASARAAAIPLLRRGCELGHLTGCSFLGNELAVGSTVPQNLPEAERLLRLACAGDAPQACELLAQNIQQGRIAGTPAEAETLLRRACAGGIQRACPAAATPAVASPAAPTPPEEPRRRRRHRHRDDDD